MDIEPLLRRVDRIAGGRQAHVRVPEAAHRHARTASAFRWVSVLLAVELVIGVAAVVIAVVLTAQGHPVARAAWMRSVVVLGMTATLFYFALRAARGWRWAYQRLRLFSQIFPVVTLVMAAIPGLYPAWMVTEQILFSLVMIGVSDLLTSDHMRLAYRHPDKPLPTFD